MFRWQRGSGSGPLETVAATGGKPGFAFRCARYAPENLADLPVFTRIFALPREGLTASPGQD